MDRNPAYVALREEISTQIRDLRRAGRLEKRDPLTEPESRYHPGCFTVAQVASHTGLSAQVVYQAIAGGKIKAEARVVGGRARYAIRPEEAQRFAAEIEQEPDEAARRDTNYLRQIAEAGLLTVRDLAGRWGLAEHKVLLQVKQHRIPNRKWGRYRVFERANIEAFEAERSVSMIGTATKTRRDSTTYPELVKTPPAGEREAAYQAALKLVARIDEDLTRGIRHYRTRAGELLTSLDEVVRAILGNDLLVPEAEVEPVVWISSRHNGVYHG